MIDDVSGPAIARLYEDAAALFAHADALVAAPAPRVTLDLPASDPEPLHAFVWGTAREYGVARMLTGGLLKVTFHMWMTVVATAPTEREASRIANAYQAIALQIALCDNQLGGSVDELSIVQVREADAWADPDGRRHAGYLLDYEAAVDVAVSAEAGEIIGKAGR